MTEAWPETEKLVRDITFSMGWLLCGLFLYVQPPSAMKYFEPLTALVCTKCVVYGFRTLKKALRAKLHLV